MRSKSGEEHFLSGVMILIVPLTILAIAAYVNSHGRLKFESTNLLHQDQDQEN